MSSRMETRPEMYLPVDEDDDGDVSSNEEEEDLGHTGEGRVTYVCSTFVLVCDAGSASWTQSTVRYPRRMCEAMMERKVSGTVAENSSVCAAGLVVVVTDAFFIVVIFFFCSLESNLILGL